MSFRNRPLTALTICCGRCAGQECVSQSELHHQDSLVVMFGNELAGVFQYLLDDPVVSLKAPCDEIIAALDFLFAGIELGSDGFKFN